MSTIPVNNGISKLSLKRGVENSSIIVAIRIANKLISMLAGESANIMIDVLIKNAVEPSKDLLNNFVFPYFIPTMAAAESDMLIINRDIIAIFSLNKSIVMAAPINTQEAPESIFL